MRAVLQRVSEASVKVQGHAVARIGRGLAVGTRIVVLVEGRVVYDVPRTDVELDTFPQLYRELTA